MDKNVSITQTPVQLIQPNSSVKPKTKNRAIKLMFRIFLVFLLLSLIYIFFLAKSEFFHLINTERDLKNNLKEKDKEITFCKDELDKLHNTWVETGNCFSKLINISITSYPKSYSCFVRVYDGEIKLVRNDGIELLFADMWATEGFPTNCPKLVTHLSLGDANQDIKFCLSQQSQWILLDRIIYDKKMFDSTTQKQGSFDVFTLKGFSKEPTDTDINELKTIFDSIVLMK